jgi:hypothetical protein
MFGNPQIENEFGHIAGNCLVFNPKNSTYEQIRLDLGQGQTHYNLSFDIETRNLDNSKYGFGILFDTPDVRTFTFHGGLGKIDVFSPPDYFGLTHYDFSDNTLMHVNANVDLQQGRWSLWVNNQSVGDWEFYSENGDIQAIRFSLSPCYGGIGIDRSIVVAIDNILVTPEPATLLLLALGGLLIRRK